MRLAPSGSGDAVCLGGGRLTAFDKFYIAALFFYCFLLFSLTVYALFPVIGLFANAMRFFIAGVLAIFALQQTIQRGSVRINKGLLLISFVFILLAILPSAYHQTPYLLFRRFISFYLVYMFFLFYKKKYLKPVIDIATCFLFVMLALSIVGFVYAFLGYPPIMAGATPEGRVYYLYLTTGAVDNGVLGNIIRPQGISEEPGSFSFIICTLCCLRVLTKRRESVTFALMLLGNITFSMIHIIIFVLYVLHLIMRYKIKKAFALYAVGVAMMIAVAYLPLMETVNEVLLSRFAVDQATGQMSGNNRAFLFDNAVKIVAKDNAALFWGMQRDAHGRSPLERTWIYGGNPLSPMLEYGIFIAWLYYFYLLFFALCGAIDRKNFIVYLSIILMLMQRPEFCRGGPTADLLLLFFTSYDMIKNRIVSQKNSKSKCADAGVGIGAAGV
jgi:hypothetical protein